MQEDKMGDLRVTFPKPCPEQWDAMTPTGCDRHCASCDQVVLDLAELTIAEVEDHIASGAEICVRAQIDARGQIALKSNAWRDARRMFATVGAGIGLLTSGGAAVAGGKQPKGVIAGKVENVDWGTRVTATGADGKTYKANVKNNGDYKIKHVPPGTYSLTFIPSCGDPWDAGTSIVVAGKTTAKNTTAENKCIIVGLLEVEDNNG
jgi:hypothetical protein